MTEASSLGSLVDPNATNVACARDPPPPPRALLLALRMFEREKEGSQTCPAGDPLRSKQGSTSTIIRPPSSERREGSKSIPTSPTSKSPLSRTARVRYWLPRLPLACFASFASARGSYVLYPRLVQPLASRASQRSTGRRLSVSSGLRAPIFPPLARSPASPAAWGVYTQSAHFAHGLLGQSPPTRRRRGLRLACIASPPLLSPSQLGKTGPSPSTKKRRRRPHQLVSFVRAVLLVAHLASFAGSFLASFPPAQQTLPRLLRSLARTAVVSECAGRRVEPLRGDYGRRMGIERVGSGGGRARGETSCWCLARGAEYPTRLRIDGYWATYGCGARQGGRGGESGPGESMGASRLSHV